MPKAVAVAHQLIRSPARPALAFIGLSFTLAGCPDNQIAEDGCAEDCSYTDSGYNDGGNPTGDADDGYYCPTAGGGPGGGCYNDDGYNDSFDTGWDEYSDSFDEGYYPTTDYTDVTTLPDTTNTVSTSTTDTDPSGDTTDTQGDSEFTTGTSTGVDTEPGDTSGTSTTGLDTDTTGTTDTTDTDTDTGGLDAFPPAGAFGDDVFGVQELDLVGTWSLQWAPDATTPDSVLTIDSNGEFIWRETSTDCTTDTLATGFVWVEASQLVMHVESWERQLPFDTLAALGEDFPAPFRIRMNYGLLGPTLGLIGPTTLTGVTPYTGRAYIQLQGEGQFIAGDYYGETELWAVRQGDTQAKVIVRERFIGDLDKEPALDPESTGIVHHDQIFWGADPPILGLDVFESGGWTCYGGCPQPAGQTLINGDNNYAYGPYAGFQRMMVFASGRSFKRDVGTDCP